MSPLPVGILLSITAAQAGARATAVIGEVPPFLAALLVLLALIVCVPTLTLWLPGVAFAPRAMAPKSGSIPALQTR